MAKEIELCMHCGWRCSGKYCPRCNSAEKRREMDKENKKINPNFVCKVCDLKWYSVFTKEHYDGTIQEN